jgi:hypothetical protein
MKQATLWQCRILVGEQMQEHIWDQEEEHQVLHKEMIQLIMTLGIKSKDASSVRRGSYNPSRLRLIEMLALVVAVCIATLGQAQDVKPALAVSVAAISRTDNGRVEIRYELRNQGDMVIYIPFTQAPGVTYMTTLSLLHQTGEGAWVAVGPYYDIPSDTAKPLQPGATLSLVDEFSDPAVAILADAQAGKKKVALALHGQNKLRIRYFAGEVNWGEWLKAGKKGGKGASLAVKPPMVSAYSTEFNIPISTK